MHTDTSVDVIVVGAGPAGAWAARSLARAGARVTVFDHSHPREKPCGGGVTGRAWTLVADALAGKPVTVVPVTRAIFDDPRTTAATVGFDDGASADASLMIVDRRTFDASLLDAAREAGAVHRAERVLDVQASRGCASVRTPRATYHARWVIGADGANSLVRRRLQHAFTRRQLSIATGVFVRGRSDDAVIIRFVSDPAGYIWSFPRCDHLAVGICAQADDAEITPLRRAFEAWLAGSGLATGARLEPYAWPIPSLGPGDIAAEFPAGDAHLLVGDAAGLVDPITREGIYFALLSGQLAADAIAREAEGAVERYVQSLRSHVYPELIRAARLKQGFFHGPFTRLLVDALRHSAAVRAVMVDLVAGEQPYRTLKRRLLRTFEWRLAWQLLRLEHRSSH